MSLLTFRAAGATATGGIGLTVNQTLDAAIQVGDVIFWAVSAAENTRGWGSGIDNVGSVPGFTDLSTAAIATVLHGRSQYQQDDGVSTRRWLWLGYKIATVLETGGATISASLASAPAFGVGIASAYTAYANPGSAPLVYSVNATKTDSPGGAGSYVAPATTNPAGSTGTFTYGVSITNAAWRAAQTSVIFGGSGEARVLVLMYGEGGAGVWNGPAALTDRVRWGGLGGPWYMMTWSDGPTASSTSLGRLPLLGAG